MPRVGDRRRLVSAAHLANHNPFHVVEADPIVVEALGAAPLMALMQYLALTQILHRSRERTALPPIPLVARRDGLVLRPVGVTERFELCTEVVEPQVARGKPLGARFR